MISRDTDDRPAVSSDLLGETKSALRYGLVGRVIERMDELNDLPAA